ncbi:MAG: hypothetical protein GY708_00105 [Actinomycetia bacterium]|nr:hypothetical protein [Actinomycetes bacterium]MCP5035179.1 hypothetical protein [Actinomycetes bacterium]
MNVCELSLPFVARGLPGMVNVEVYPNSQPASVGSADWAQGFPICKASIDWEAEGYNALLGWVQLVGMRAAGTDDSRHWVTDPLEIYNGLNTPFGFYGLSPTLFDAPARSDRTRSLDWCAESFLCFAPSSPMAREAHPVGGFSWGFVLSGDEIKTIEPKAIERAAWTRHLDLLRSTYSGWTFPDQP